MDLASGSGVGPTWTQARLEELWQAARAVQSSPGPAWAEGAIAACSMYRRRGLATRPSAVRARAGELLRQACRVAAVRIRAGLAVSHAALDALALALGALQGLCARGQTWEAAGDECAVLLLGGLLYATVHPPEAWEAAACHARCVEELCLPDSFRSLLPAWVQQQQGEGVVVSLGAASKWTLAACGVLLERADPEPWNPARGFLMAAATVPAPAAPALTCREARAMRTAAFVAMQLAAHIVLLGTRASEEEAVCAHRLVVVAAWLGERTGFTQPLMSTAVQTSVAVMQRAAPSNEALRTAGGYLMAAAARCLRRSVCSGALREEEAQLAWAIVRAGMRAAHQCLDGPVLDPPDGPPAVGRRLANCAVQPALALQLLGSLLPLIELVHPQARGANRAGAEMVVTPRVLSEGLDLASYAMAFEAASYAVAASLELGFPFHACDHLYNWTALLDGPFTQAHDAFVREEVGVESHAPASAALVALCSLRAVARRAIGAAVTDPQRRRRPAFRDAAEQATARRMCGVLDRCMRLVDVAHARAAGSGHACPALPLAIARRLAPCPPVMLVHEASDRTLGLRRPGPHAPLTAEILTHLRGMFTALDFLGKVWRQEVVAA